MRKNALVLGYFGYEDNQLDGQTVKTRNIYSLLKNKQEKYFNRISYFDTQSFQKNKINVLKAFNAVRSAEVIYYLPAQKNLKYIFPFIFIISFFFNVKVKYLVVGGWLFEFLQNKPLHRSFLKRIDRIYPETKNLAAKLTDNYGFNNVQQLHNYRIHDFTPTFNEPKDIIKVVFLARVTKEKGVDTVINLTRFLKHNNLSDKLIIDIYGPINSIEEESLNKEFENNPLLNYKGIVEPENVNAILNEYDFLIFPTRYPGEGFPGTILDAYISGIPVIASNWRYIPEFIDHGVTGFLYDVENENDFFQCVIKLIKNRELILPMKRNAYKKSKEYSSETAWEILKPHLI